MLNTPTLRYRVKIVLEQLTDTGELLFTNDGDPRRETIVYESTRQDGALHMYAMLCATALTPLADSGVSAAEL